MDEANQNRPETLLHFGDFALNVVRRGLYRGQERVRLTAKPLETLIFLVENRGRVVEKQEILNAVWKGTFVTEDTLVHAIREIRRALADDRDNPRFILTVPREGYRFVCEVVAPSDAEAFKVSTDSVRSVDPSTQRTTLSSALGSTVAQKQIDSFEQSVTVVEPRRSRRWLIPVVAASLVLLSTTLIVWRSPLNQWLARWLNPAENQPVKPLRVGSQTLVTTKPFSEGKPALSNDGKLMLYISTNPDDDEKTPDGKTRSFGDLFVKEMASGHFVQITHQANPSGDIPVFTHDGNFVVYAKFPRTGNGSSLPDLYKVASFGTSDKDGNPIVEKNPEPFIREATGAGFSPDGQWIAYTKHLSGRKLLWRSPANDPEVVHTEIAPYGFTPRWSPDGKWLAYTTSNPEGGVGDIWVMDANYLRNPKNVTNEPQQIYGITWTPDSRFLIFSSKRAGPPLLWGVPIEGGKAQPVTGSSGDFSTPSMSSVNNLLVFSYYHGAQNLFISQGLDADVRNLTKDDYHKYPRLSPSGQFVASVMQRPVFGEHLFVTDLLGNPTSLNDHTSKHPVWLAEKKLVYLRGEQSSQQTEVIELDITDPKKPVPTLLKPFPGKADWLDVNPVDGTKLVVVLSTGERQQIVMRDLATNQEVVIASGLEYAHLRWSPDGSLLAWSGPAETGKESEGIWVIRPMLETVPQRIVPEGFGPVWAANNSVIYFAKIGNQSGLFEYDLRTKKERKRRSWGQTPYFDVVGERLVYCELGSSFKSLIYSLTVE